MCFVFDSICVKCEENHTQREDERAKELRYTSKLAIYYTFRPTQAKDHEIAIVKLSIVFKINFIFIIICIIFALNTFVILTHPFQCNIRLYRESTLRRDLIKIDKYISSNCSSSFKKPSCQKVKPYLISNWSTFLIKTV